MKNYIFLILILFSNSSLLMAMEANEQDKFELSSKIPQAQKKDDLDAWLDGLSKSEGKTDDQISCKKSTESIIMSWLFENEEKDKYFDQMPIKELNEYLISIREESLNTINIERKQVLFEQILGIEELLRSIKISQTHGLFKDKLS